MNRQQSAAPLAGLNIWLTRPLDQVQEILPWLAAQGAKALHLPMMHIEPLASDHEIRQRLLDLDRYEMAIFISTNAAQIGLQYVFDYWPQYPVGLRNYAVGPTTARVLEAQGLSVEYPQGRMTSEALLALPSLANISGESALIFRGVGGRETLAKGLRERGARVDYVELYRRVCPDYHQNYLQRCLREQAPHALVVTSAEALDNLCQVMGFWPDLYQVPILLSSLRLVELAREAGFAQVREMAGANDPAVQQALLDLAHEQRYS